MTYLHKEAFEYNGSAVTHMLHIEVFLNEEGLGQHLYPKISVPPDIHCVLSVQSIIIGSVSWLRQNGTHFLTLHY